jgi:adenosylcobyric acid synthase
MLQGTGSDVGKSLIVAGLARAFSNRGLKVAPFKPQNMSNNAAVTAEGGEIGRAQALQARAARLAPSVDMNPVLLKPQDSSGSQIIVQGAVYGTAPARAYQQLKPSLLPRVLESFSRLRAKADLVLIEGAGSAVEVNLRAGDIANMGFAQAAQAPVVIVGDIDRGGIFAQLVGCRAVLEAADAALVKGFIVNKFRGDPSLFADGMELIAQKTGWRALGLAPYFAGAARLPAEDSFALRNAAAPGGAGAKIAVPILPHIANFDDFDPLRAEPGLALQFVQPGAPLPGDANLVILPGSKATIADLIAFRAEGWHIDLLAHLRRGGRILGICGGYQMLGQKIIDPSGVEGPAGETDGLGLLDVTTVLGTRKKLREVAGELWPEAAAFRGYEMHMGQTSGPDCARPVLRFSDGRREGATSRDGLVEGHYVHGLFAQEAPRAALASRLKASPSTLRYEAMIESTLDGLADHLARCLDLEAVLEIAQ